MNLNYKKIYDIYNNSFRYKYLTIWQERMNDEVEMELKKLFPKRKNPTWDNLPIGKKDEINTRWKPIAKRLNDALDKREKLLKDLLWKAAKEEIKIIFTDKLQEVYSCNPYKYNSQPNRISYAKGDAEQKIEYLQGFGVTCELRKENERTYKTSFGQGYDCDFVVYANIEQWQFDYLEKQPTDFMEELVSLWKHGINPQVKYHGFLSDEDFHKSMDIYMGKTA